MGSPVRIARAWREEVWTTTTSIAGDPRPAAVSRHVYQACALIATVHGVEVAGAGSHDDRPRAFRAAVLELRRAAWRVLGERQPPDVVDLAGAWPFPAVTIARQRGRRRWYAITEAQADDLRDAVPPRSLPGAGLAGFMVGEAAGHDPDDVPVHTAIVRYAGRWYARDVRRDAAAVAAAIADLRAALEGSPTG